MIDLLSSVSNVNISSLSQSELKLLAPLLILATESMLSSMNTTKEFQTIINEISQLKPSVCCMYPRYARKMFVSYAVKYLVIILSFFFFKKIT